MASAGLPPVTVLQRNSDTLPPTERVPPQLPAEVLILVISHLRRPLPPPNGQNLHSSIRQGDLAVLMRVSKLFNNLASRLLYSTIICDNLHTLIHNLGEPPSASDIPSKSALLAYTRNLCLEYAAFPLPTYIQLMKSGVVPFQIVAPDKKYVVIYRKTEARMFAACAKQRIPAVQLDHISTAMYLGGQEYETDDLVNDPPDVDLKSLGLDARTSIHPLLINDLAPPLCQRIGYGPLSCVTFFWRAENAPPSPHGGDRHRVHLDMTTLSDALPTYLGGHIDFFLSAKADEEPGAERVDGRIYVQAIVTQQL